MMDSGLSPQERLLRDRINSIVPDSYRRLENIASLDPEKSRPIVSLILQFCCAAQHMGAIGAGRNAFKRLPVSWTTVNLPFIIGQAVNLEDAWQYRRFLELLRETDAELLQIYVATGLKSPDPEIREAGSDFADQE